MRKRIKKHQLIEYAYTHNISYEESDTYKELRQKLPVKSCKNCGSEFLNGWKQSFCSESCEIQYTKEH